MKRKVLILILTFFMIFPHSVHAATNPFTDVSSSLGNTTYNSILWAYENGIVKGTGNNTFSPQSSSTRAQLCVMLWRLKGKPSVSSCNNPFRDVSDALGNTTYKSILWAYDQGIVKGTKEGVFNPNGETTRGQMAVMLWRLAGKPEVTLTKNPFVDVTSSMGNTTYKAILWAYENEITKGTDNTHFSPDNVCTRAQLAVFLYRVNNKYQLLSNSQPSSPQPTTPVYNYTYIGHKNNKVFHENTCVSVKIMNEENKVYFKSRQEAVDLGYRPCHNCNP